MGDICKYSHISDNYFPVKSFLVFPWESGRVVTTNQVWASPGAAIQCWEIFKILVISERSPQLFQIISEVKMGAMDSEEEAWAEVTFLISFFLTRLSPIY